MSLYFSRKKMKQFVHWQIKRSCMDIRCAFFKPKNLLDSDAKHTEQKQDSTRKHTIKMKLNRSK